MIGNFELTEINANDLAMEKRKELAITSVFPGISKYHMAALSVFIDEELQKYNVRDLSMQNNRFKEVISSIGLESPGKKAATLAPYMLKFTLDCDKAMQVISISLAKKSN